MGATAYQTVAHPMFIRQEFDRVIVDEAGQLDEPSTLGPLASEGVSSSVVITCNCRRWSCPGGRTPRRP